MIHHVVYGETSRTLRHVVPAAVSSVGYVIEDITRSEGTSERSIASGTWNSTVTLTLDDAAGAGQGDPSLVPVESTASASVGYHYFATKADGTFEVARLVGVTTGESVRMDRPLMGAYASSDTLELAEIEVSYPDDAGYDESYTEERRPLRVAWEYTIDGRLFKRFDQIRMVRFNEAGDSNESKVITSLLELFPGLVDRLPTAELGVLPGWAKQATAHVRNELDRRKVPAHETAHGYHFHEAAVWKTAVFAAMNGATPGHDGSSLEFIEMADRHYRNATAAMFGGLPGQETVDIPVEADTATSVSSRKRRGRLVPL